MDKVDDEKEISSEKPKAEIFGQNNLDAHYVPAADSKSNKTYSLKGSFKSSQLPDESHDRSLKGNMNTPIFKTYEPTSKLSTIEK